MRTVRILNNLHQVRFWNNLHQVRYCNNLHQVRYCNNLHQVRFWNNLLSGTLKIERLESQIALKVLGASKPKAVCGITQAHLQCYITSLMWFLHWAWIQHTYSFLQNLIRIIILVIRDTGQPNFTNCIINQIKTTIWCTTYNYHYKIHTRTT